MEPTKEMIDYFKQRTEYHLSLVRKWSDKIASIGDNRISKVLLDKERDDHDEYKWVDPEYTPYLFITWNYKCKKEGVPFDLPTDIKDQMNAATFHHIKNHKHHPEYWDINASIKSLNAVNRDAPSGNIVDGTGMPMTYVASMCADWFAMSEELGTHPLDWAKANVNVRWKFDDDQIKLIYDLIDRVWSTYD